MIHLIKKITLIAFLFAMTLLPIVASCQYATYYADKYEGRRCYYGDIFRQDKMTCATNMYPNGTILRIHYKGKWVDVRVNDRMHPSKKGFVDLSQAAFDIIADRKKGKIKVKIEIIKK